MRLIDADAITYELWTTTFLKNSGYYYAQNKYLVDKRDIVMMPTIDAVPRELYESMEATCYKLQQALSKSWIPCSERLPTYDDGDGVLVSTTKAFGGLVEVIHIWTSSVELYYKKGWVTAWMPLPPSYRGDSE